MAIEKVRDFFGVKYLIPYNKTSRKPEVVLRAIGEVAFENNIDRVPLLGGHTEAPHDVEFGQPEPAMTGTLREYPKDLFEILETTTVTENAAESDGSVGTVTNHQGTSVVNASNGISAVAVKTAQKANLKFGQYVFVAVGTGSVDIHVIGLHDSFDNIEGRAEAAVDVSSAGSVDVDDLGITITVSGTPNMTTGDTGACEVRPENTGSTEIIVGAGTAPSNFGVRCIFPRKTDGVLHWIDVFDVAARGTPWRGVSREWSEFDINWGPLARSSDGAVYELHRVLGV